MEKLFELFYQTMGVCTDTRKIVKDCLFICLSGENFDGNQFANEALNLGAKFVIVDCQGLENNETIFYVKNSLSFLQKLANFHRKKFSIPIIGITGSNGKTTTKELMNCVLSKKYTTLATVGNFNNHIGVPLTLLNLKKEHELAIIEMGANKFFDIKELCEIAQPTHGIITNIGKAHLEGFIDFNGVLKTKKELYDSIENSNGVLFYNNDDEILKSILPNEINSVSYGTNNENFVFGELLSLNPFIEMKWSDENNLSQQLNSKLIGKYNFYNLLASICIGKYFNVSNDDISNALMNYEPSNNRSQIIKTAKNTLILDAYNANPTSMKSAIESFSMIDNSSKIAILGDMFELGNESKKEHQSIVELVIDLNLKCFFVGKYFYEFEHFKDEQVFFFENKKELHHYIDNKEINHSLVLLKGSRGVGLEEFVEKL
jgi:UDP-N-acetylmuramoyl-tripeptide--D-alanyl-D-alanine ligase